MLPNKALQRTANSAVQSGSGSLLALNPGASAAATRLLAAAERQSVRRRRVSYAQFQRAIACTTLATLLVAGCALRRSESDIRAELLERAPLGSSMSDVRSLIQERSWEVAYDDESRGFLDQRVRPPQVVGTSSIRAELGNYQGLPWRTFVTVFWGFDAEGKLIDVWVWKTHDTL